MGIMIAKMYSTVFGILFICSGALVRKLFHPFPKHRFKFSRYGIVGKIYAYGLGTGLTVLVILSMYYSFFNYDAAYLVEGGMLIMLVGCIPMCILDIREEIRLAQNKDKNCNYDLG